MPCIPMNLFLNMEVMLDSSVSVLCGACRKQAVDALQSLGMGTGVSPFHKVKAPAHEAYLLAQP